MNILIYVGLTVYYFKMHKDLRKQKDYNKNGDGIVDIIMMVLSVALLVFLLLTKREENKKRGMFKKLNKMMFIIIL